MSHTDAPVCPELDEALTVIAGFEATDPRLEVMQALVSQWSPPDGFAGFAAHDAGATGGLNATGYFGAVFDGRYVYFSPEMHGDQTTHGVVLRCDTQGDFKDASAWSAFDASQTAGLETRGFYGAACDGRYVYFIPRQIDVDHFHSRLLRYDTQRAFDDPAAWDAHDVGLAQSAQSASFDGRYLYFCPGFVGDPTKEDEYCGRVIRVDTQGNFHSDDSYTSVDPSEFLGPEARCFDGGAFDGRYIYFVPLYDGVVIRYDTQSPFGEPASWQKYDLKPFGYELSVGAVFDGVYLYFCPYNHARVFRFDTRKPFEDEASWTTYDADETDGLRTKGFDGGFFDGRYVWFQPFFYHVGPNKRDNVFHSHYLRYDVTRPFDDSASWQAYDASATDGLKSVGYNAGAFDGRYFYAAPWQQGPDPTGVQRCITHGNVLRVDTLGDGNGAFSLRYCDYGHNGGLNAGAPGPTFIVNTEDGRTLSVGAHAAPPAGRHQMAGVYDGRELKLYIDGQCVARRAAAGRIAKSTKPVTVGRIDGGGGAFAGNIDDVVVRDIAHTPSEIMAIAHAYLQRKPQGLALTIELDTYFVLDDRSTLSGAVRIAAGDDVADQPIPMTVRISSIDGEDVVWEQTWQINPQQQSSIDLAIPVGDLHGEYRVQVDAPSGEHEVAFICRQIRDNDAQPTDYASFVRRTIDTIIEHQSLPADGVPFVTVTTPIHRGYASLGHKENGKYRIFWFPESPYERDTFRPDFDLWPAMERLSRCTGDPRYARLVERMGAAVAKHAFDPASGLMYDSQESDLDLRTWQPNSRGGWAIAKFKPRNSGEHNTALLPYLWKNAPQETRRAMRSVFLGLITDPQRMDFNRFCFFGWDDGEQQHSLTPNASHCAFDTAASRMIAWWCEAYARTGEADFLTWAQRMADKWAAVQHPHSGLMPNFFGAAAWDPHRLPEPGEWCETRGASLTAATLSEAAAALEGGVAPALREQLNDMAIRLARGVATYAYDAERHLYREHLRLDGSPYCGAARYTFATQAEKDEAVKEDPATAKVPVYDGAGFFRHPTYYAHVVGSSIPWHLAKVMTAYEDQAIASRLAEQAADGVEEATALDGPFTTDGYWTFHASARLIAVLVSLAEMTGDAQHINAARRVADREIAALGTVAHPQWWRLPERAALLDALLMLAEHE